MRAVVSSSGDTPVVRSQIHKKRKLSIIDLFEYPNRVKRNHFVDIFRQITSILDFSYSLSSHL